MPIKGTIVPGIDIPNNIVGTFNLGFHKPSTPLRGIALKRKNVPEWFYNAKKVRAFLKRRFPKLRTDSYQQHRAAMWYVLIREWFVLVLSETEIMKRTGFVIY